MVELSEGYLKNGSQVIQNFERNLENDIRARSKLFQAISIIFPSPFYLSINNEIISRGYKNFIRFHTFVFLLPFPWHLQLLLQIPPPVSGCFF
jgi:hypothetical protein